MTRISLFASVASCLAACLSATAVQAASFTQFVAGNSYSIVEADAFLTGGVAGNTVDVANPALFWAQVGGGNVAGKYSYRDFGGIHFNAPAGKLAADPDLFEVASQNPAGPNLRTSFSVPNGTYEVYLIQMVAGANAASQGLDAALLADLDVGQALPTTLRNSTQAGIIKSGILVTPAAPNFELALNPLGTVTGSNISVLVGPVSSPNPFGVRNDYIGIAYAAVPEPASILLVGIGACAGMVGYARRRQRNINASK